MVHNRADVSTLSVTDSAVTASPPRSAALTTRYVDFWLLGGASLVLWLVMVSLEGFRQKSWAIDHHFANVMTVTATLSLVVNYPHFMASYKLAYGKGARFVLTHWFQLLAVPALLLALFVYAYAAFTAPSALNPFVVGVNRIAEWLGLRTRIGQSRALGEELLSLSVILMFITVGWHYAKQVYGCMMVYARFDRYPLDPRQRRLLKWNLHGVWWCSFFFYFTPSGAGNYFGLPYHSLALPAVLVPLSAGYLVLAGLASVYWIGYRNYRRHGRLPGANFLVPAVAMHVWLLPVSYQREFLAIVPLFHSLQYLPFVYRWEMGRLKDVAPATLHVRGTVIILALVATGYIGFELIPNTLDMLTDAHGQLRVWFFFIAAQVLLNVHHYFNDNVLWRFKDEDVRRYVLAD